MKEDENGITSEIVSAEDARADEEAKRMKQGVHLLTEGCNVLVVQIAETDFMLLSFVVEGDYVNMLLPIAAADPIGQGMLDAVAEYKKMKAN